MSTASLPRKPRTLGPRQNIALIASLYNEEYVNGLLASAQQELQRILPESTLPVFRVPGAYEIPVCAQYIAKHTEANVIVALGVVIRGQTGHADLITKTVCDSLQSIAVENLIPVINEVLLVDSEEHARERCLGDRINRGVEAARAAAGMAEMFQKLRKAYP